MAVHVSSENFDEDPSALYRGRPPRVARVRAIAPTARLLAPTQSSLVRARAKALTRQEKEKEERRQDERKRRRLTKVAKANGRLTIPQSPKFHPHPRARPSFRNAQLTMTSRELEEIAAIRQRVASMRNKTRRYHEQTTRAFPSVPRTKDNAKFTVALQASGGLGVPAVRRAKLTEPVGFDFAIDRRLNSRKRPHSSEPEPTQPRMSTGAKRVRVSSA